jgi:hypothetical protein
MASVCGWLTPQRSDIQSKFRAALMIAEGALCPDFNTL